MFTLTTHQKLALASAAQRIVLQWRRANGNGKRAQVTRRGLLWDLDLAEGIDFAIWLLGAFEPDTIAAYQELTKPGAVVLDIGANIGAHTLHLAAAVGPYGRVIAFEPTDYAYRKLSRNLELNPALAIRVTALQLMLMDQTQATEPAPVYSSWPLTPEADAVHPLHGGRLERCSGARMTTLDQALAEQGVERVDLIKLDIDGYETAMLRGAAATLARFRPVIVMELAPYVLRERGSSLGDLLDLLKAADYQLFDVATRKQLPVTEDVLDRLIPKGGGRNIVARPPQ